MHGLNTKNIGNNGENLACKYLKKQGYEIIARNLYIGKSEINIIAKDGKTLVFVEVKNRYTSSYGSPLEAVTEKKIKNIIFSAKMYITANSMYNVAVRFDVIGIDGEKIEHIKDAFWLN